MEREALDGDFQSTNSQLFREMWEYIKSNAKRILVVVFLIYLFRLVEVGRHLFWYPGHGYHWPNIGYQLFPIPISPTSTDIIAYPPLGLADGFLYLVFVGNGMWIIWIALSLIYILLPSIRMVRDTHLYP